MVLCCLYVILNKDVNRDSALQCCHHSLAPTITSSLVLSRVFGMFMVDTVLFKCHLKLHF